MKPEPYKEDGHVVHLLRQGQESRPRITSPIVVEAIQELRAKGKSLRVIAAMMGEKESTLRRVLRAHELDKIALARWNSEVEKYKAKEQP